MTHVEVMKQMVEALEMPCNYWNKTQFIKVHEAIKAGRQAIEQAEPSRSDIKQSALDAKADNARELGLDYEPVGMVKRARPRRIGKGGPLVYGLFIQPVHKGLMTINPTLKVDDYVYANPQPQKPLMEQMKNDIARRAFKDICKEYPVQERILRVIDDVEAAHGIGVRDDTH